MNKDMNGVSPIVSVKESANMMMPDLENMLKKREYPILPTPPICHARLSGNPKAKTYYLTYNGFDIVKMQFKQDCKPSVRFHSDGDFQSYPFIQQFIIAADQEAEIAVTVSFPHEMVCMRPQRAETGQAILGQWGHPLIHGVNGLYSLLWDYLVTWHGYDDFQWKSKAIRQDNGVYSASFIFRLGSKPWIVLLKPRFYGMHLGYENHKPWLRRPNEEPITGWCSWEAYHSDVTQEHIQAAAAVLAPLRKYGFDTMQLDDGYQNTLVPPAPGKPIGDSWLTTNKKFPDGHQGIVSAMQGAGFRAGIWTNATLTNREACLEYPNVLRKADGELIFGDWIQYIIDCTPEMLKAEIEPYYRELREAGYDYFKSDSIRHLIFDGLQEAVRLGLLSDDDAHERMKAYMQAARNGIGEDAYYLSCWGTLSQSIGVCDAMRVATDANASWCAFSMQLRETARWFFTQRILFTLDPDHVCVRSELPWVRMMLSLVTLTGGLYMISDKPETYDEQRLALVRKTVPGLAVRTAETGPVQHNTPACYSTRRQADPVDIGYEIGHYAKGEATPFASLWCTHFEQDGRDWSVTQRCAVTPLPNAEISVTALGLDETRTYYAFDFWKQAGAVVTGGTISFPALSLGDTTVYGLFDITDGTPQLVGSDRHISMDVVSIRSVNPLGNGLELSLIGFPGLVCRYTVYAPNALGKVHTEGGNAVCSTQGDIHVIEVAFTADALRLILE